MKPYLFSLAAGLLVGVVYALLHVRSPAPPTIALLGLLGILIGEQIPPVVEHLLRGELTPSAWLRSHVGPHVFGRLPQAQRSAPKAGSMSEKLR